MIVPISFMFTCEPLEYQSIIGYGVDDPWKWVKGTVLGRREAEECANAYHMAEDWIADLHENVSQSRCGVELVKRDLQSTDPLLKY